MTITEIDRAIKREMSATHNCKIFECSDWPAVTAHRSSFDEKIMF